jgi:hypothetical protein
VLETVTIEVSRDGGATWTLVAASVPNTGNAVGALDWVVSGPVTTRARIRVTSDSNGAVQDAGNANFRIEPGPALLVADSNAASVLGFDAVTGAFNAVKHLVGVNRHIGECRSVI